MSSTPVRIAMLVFYSLCSLLSLPIMMPLVLYCRFAGSSTLGMLSSMKISKDGKFLYALDIALGTAIEVEVSSGAIRLIASKFVAPHGIELIYDENQAKPDLAICDFVSGKIFRVNITTGDCNVLESGLFSAARMTVTSTQDGSKHLLVSQALLGKVISIPLDKVDEEAKSTTFLKGIASIDDLNTSSNGRLLACTFALNGDVRAIDKSGQSTILIKDLFFPAIISATADKLIISELAGNKLHICDLTESEATIAKSLSFGIPTGNDVHAEAGIFVTSSMSGCIFSIDDDLNIKTIAKLR